MRIRRSSWQKLQRSAPPLAVCTWLVAACVLHGCGKRAPKAVRVPEMAQGFDAGPIDASDLTNQHDMRHHVLNMGMTELSHRLKSFVLRNQTTITIKDDSAIAREKVHTGVYVLDEAGNTHLQAGNADHQLELIAVDDKAFVRQDLGHLRQKRRQEVDELEMAEAQAANVRELLQHFRGVTLVHSAKTTVDGREATRYAVQLSDTKEGPVAPQPSLALAAVAAPSRWQEVAKHHRLMGKVVVDNASGALLRADITGSMAIVGATGQPSTVTLQVSQTISEIGTVSAVKEPKESISEIRRPIRPRDPLSFFRQAQIGRPPEGSKASGDNGAPQSDDPQKNTDGQEPDEELPQDD